MNLVSWAMPSLAQLERLLAAEPTDAFVLYAIAQEHGKQKDFARAIEFYDRCIAADPGYSYAYYHKARALEAMGAPGSVQGTLEAGLKAASEQGDAKAKAEISGYLATL
jgi:tetratricopeptide (TPR) repeat protein